MKTLLMKCPSCRSYTLRATCPKCGGTTFMSMPAKYSPEDRYGEYRRRLKNEMSGV
ncbi:MAG: RNA-protein complex protein Nop10 [Candidatus Thermoplasmatota archaeon]|nr:RNA-protein complex protein Nop10 [Candidatus Thermoplasmatota archaeon]